MRLESVLGNKYITRRRQGQVPRDSGDGVLRAYAIDIGGNQRDSWRRLPFNNQQIISALKPLIGPNRDTIYNQYMSLGASDQQAVDRLIRGISCLSSKSRTCLAISSQFLVGNPSRTLIVFYAVGSPVEPVRVRIQGRLVEFPFEGCLTWGVRPPPPPSLLFISSNA